MTATRLTESDRTQIVDLYLSGQTAPQIAEQLGTTPSVVLGTLKKLGIPRRPVGSDGRKTTPELDQRIGELYQSGLSKEGVAQQTNTSAMIVTRVLRELGITPRSPAPPRSYDVRSDAFDDLSQEHAAYWLGFLYADGTVRRTCLNVALAAKDLGHLEVLARFLGTKQPRLTPRNTAWLQVSDRPLADRLRELGVEPNRPRPTVTFDAVPKEARHHFLRGCFDGDGCVYAKPQLMIVGRLPFLHAVQDTLCADASANPIGISQQHEQWGKLYYKGIHRCLAITNYLYRDATVYLARKRDRVLSWPAPQRRKQTRYWS